MTELRLPVIAIVGRPNVGKSTILNFLVGRRTSITCDEPGTTRDRLYAVSNRFDVPIRLVDTGGLELDQKGSLEQGIWQQVQQAAKEADAIIFVLDAQAGITTLDSQVANFLRRTQKPVVIAANKADSPKTREAVHEFYSLGFPHVFAVSAKQGLGFLDLFENVFSHINNILQPLLQQKHEEEMRQELAEQLDEETAAQTDLNAEKTVSKIPDILKVAIVGKPNAGKSSFVNKLLGEERLLVSEVAGTTTDAVDTVFEYGGQRYALIDTAGIRRKRSIAKDLEKIAVSSSLNALDRCDIALLMIDATEGLTEQDMKIASFIDEKGKGVIIVVNKWDMMKNQGVKTQDFANNLKEQMPFLAFAPIRFVSAKTGSRVFDVIDTINEVAEQYFRKVGTSLFNRMLEKAVMAHQPPVAKGRRIKLYFGTQVTSAPPTFVMRCNEPAGIHFSYRRYLTNQIRDAFGFSGVPIRLKFHGRDIKNKK